MKELTNLEPIYTADLFRPLHAELMAVLRALEPDGWTAPTIAGQWRVRDVAAHLLDGDLRKLSVSRDHHLVAPDRAINSYRDLVGFLNDFNRVAVTAFDRLSPRVLADLLDITGAWVADFVSAQPPHEPSVFSVDWAGESRSENWMDTGREFTERWHHQMQIRLATGHPLLMEPRWLDPLFDISVHALRRAYAEVTAPEGTAVSLAIDGRERWQWSIVCEGGRWTLRRGVVADAAATVRLGPDDAWRVLYHALPPAEAASRARLEGNASLTAPLFTARAVMV